MSKNKYEQGVGDHEEPMEAELFELAAREVNWHLSPGETDWKEAVIVRAARQVLVDGERTTAVAEAAGISQAWLSQAIGRVREQLEVICNRENWLYKMVVLPPEAMALVNHLQNKTIDPLKQLQVETIAKKRAKKIKAATAEALDGKASFKGTGIMVSVRNVAKASAAAKAPAKKAKAAGNGKSKPTAD